MTPDDRPGAARWAVVSAGGALVVLTGGWLVAATLQPSYDPVRQTISVLAGHGAQYRWVMTMALVVVGCCHVVTSLGLPAARPAARALLALGGVGTWAVAAFPLPVHGESAAHTAAASVAFAALALWPVPGVRRAGPLWLRPEVALPASTVMLALLAWFVLASATAGLAERAAVTAQALWPLLTALGLRRRRLSRR